MSRAPCPRSSEGRTIDATSFLRASRHQLADICSVAQASGVEWMRAGAEVGVACAQSRGGSNGRTGRFEAAGTSGGKAGAGAGAGPGLLRGGGLSRNVLDASKVVARVRGEVGGLARLCGASCRLRGNRALHRASAGSSVSLNVPGSLNAINFNAAMSACVKGEEWDKALYLLQQMRGTPGRAGRD